VTINRLTKQTLKLVNAFVDFLGGQGGFFIEVRKMSCSLSLFLCLGGRTCSLLLVHSLVDDAMRLLFKALKFLLDAPVQFLHPG